MPVTLITGARGFTGVYMTARLKAAGHQVVGTALHADDDQGIVACDITDPVSVQRVVETVRPDYVVHLAAIAFVGHGNVEAFYRVNLVGTRNLLAALADAPQGIRKILLVSSANVYGNAADLPLVEEQVFSPANDYAVSRVAMEYMARLWFDRLPIVIVRPFNYTGRGQNADFLIPKVVDHFRCRAPVIELGNLDVARDFSDVRTVVACYQRLLESDARGQVFNVCRGESHSLADVLALLKQLSGYMPEVHANPALVRTHEIHRLTGSRQRLEGTIGQVDDIDFAETLRWMLEDVH